MMELQSIWRRLSRLLTIDERTSDYGALPLFEAFEFDNRAKVLRGVKIAILYALVFNPAWVLLDVYEVPERWLSLFLWTRVYLEVMLFGVFALTLQKKSEDWAVGLGVATLFIAGTAMTRLALHFNPYYAGISLVMIGSVLIPWSALPSLFSGLGLSALYMTAFLLHQTMGAAHWDTFVNNSFFMLGSALVSSGVTAYAHNLRKDAFRGRYQQARAIDEQQLVNAQLSRQHKEVQARTQELAEANRKLADKSSELEQANSKLEEQYRVKSRFLDNMSHELRTPLTLIQTPVRMLLNQPLPAEQREILTGVEYAAHQLHEEINEILDISKYEQQAVTLRYVEVDPRTLVEDYVRSWTYKAKEKDLVLRLEVPEALPKVWLDRREFVKVLRNLVSNAVKFTPPRGEVTVKVVRADPWLEVSVRDTGPGISPEDQERLFKRFVQVDNAGTRMQEGTGLGLALVRDIVDLHGGGMPVLESALGKGTTITVRLPLERPAGAILAEETEERLSEIPLPPLQTPAEPSPLTVPAHVSSFLPGLQKDRILVVEDNRNLSVLLQRILSPLYTVLAAQDGQEALERIDGFQPDLVLSDIMMPRMTGTELLERVRKHPEWSRVPFILLTAKADISDRVQGLWEGANDYVTKPFHEPELLARINNLLRLRGFEKDLSRRNKELFGRSESLEGELRKRFMNTVSVLVGAIDCKDAYTAGHSERVSYYARILAEPFGLPPEDMQTLELGALMHDVGKIGIPDAVLNKPGRLTEEERAIIELHPTYADQILRRAPELDLVRQVVVHHHERWDGNGYPYRLVGEKVPFLSRIVSVADCWDAMVSDRIYRKGMDPTMALSLCKKISGSQIDPRIVDVLCQVYDRLVPPAHLKPLKLLSTAEHGRLQQTEMPGPSTCAWNDPSLVPPES